MNTTALPLTVYYDASCDLCRNEMHYLAERAGPAKIQLIDASARDFVNDSGVATEELMARIHGHDANGTALIGMALLRSVYAAAGLRWVLAPTGWFGVSHLFDRLYLFIAKHRYRMPRWLSPYTLIHKPCRNGTCRLP